MSKFVVPFCIAIAIVLSSAPLVAVAGAEAPAAKDAPRENTDRAKPTPVKKKPPPSGRKDGRDDAKKAQAPKEQGTPQDAGSDAIKAWREHDI